MEYQVCYKFSKRGQWYIYKYCKKEDLPSVVEVATSIEGVIEIKIIAKP